MCQRAEDVGALGDRHCNKQPESAGKALAYEVLTDKHADGKGDAKDQGAGKQAAEHLRIVGCNGSGDIEPWKWKPSREQHGYVPVLEGRQEVEFEDADCIRHEFAEAAGRVEANRAPGSEPDNSVAEESSSGIGRRSIVEPPFPVCQAEVDVFQSRLRDGVFADAPGLHLLYERGIAGAV